MQVIRNACDIILYYFVILYGARYIKFFVDIKSFMIFDRQ